MGEEENLQQVLEGVRESALRLLAGFQQPPSTLRIQAGEVTIEATWPAGGSSTASSVVATIPEASVEAVDSTLRYVCAPSVGVFYVAAEPGAEPFVNEGDPIAPGQQIGIVEAMKLMMPVTAELHGKVAAVLKGNGESVEYGERLFAISPVQENG